LILAAVSGAALFLAVYNKPLIAVVGIAPMWGYVRRKDWRTAGSWLAGAALCGILVAGISLALTGTPTSYLGVQRSGFTVCEPGKMPVEPAKAVPPLPSPLPRSGGEGVSSPGGRGGA